MDTTSQELPRRRNRRHSEAFKLGLVEQARQPGMSVSRVAREAGVNANQVFAWIKQHRDGVLRAQGEAAPALLAVRLAEPDAIIVAQSARELVLPSAGVSAEPSTVALGSGTLELRLAHGELKIDGTPDRETLEVVLRWLTR